MAGPKRTQYTIPLMLLAFITIGAFGYWLHLSTEAVRVAIAEDEAARAEEVVDEPTEVPLEVFAERPEEYVGEEVVLAGLQAFNQISPPLFMALLPTGQMYLVMIERGFSVEPGSFLRVVGTVRNMSENTLDSWQQQGFFTDAQQRQELSIGATFIEAQAVAVIEDEPAANGGGQGDAQD